MASSSGLKPEQIDFFKKYLQQILKGLESDIKDASNEVHQSLSQDFEDAAADREELEIVELANQVEVEEVDEIHEALQRIGSGDFGICQQCLGPVGYQRLRAIPFAKFCIQCQKEKEK